MQIAVLGALRNLSYGEANEENKLQIMSRVPEVSMSVMCVCVCVCAYAMFQTGSQGCYVLAVGGDSLPEHEHH